MRTRIATTAMTITIVAFAAALASAQTVTPANGQTPEQMTKDTQECGSSAVTSSGYNPAAPPAEADRASGGRAEGAAKAATVGAVAAGAGGGNAYDKASDNAQQEYRQNNAKDAAKVGMVAGGVNQRSDARQANRTAEEGKAAYDSAYKSCLGSRGYSVQ